jgi:Na+/proline symporter
MDSNSDSRRVSRPAFWTGCILSALLVLFMLFTGIPALLQPKYLEQGMKQFGYPPHAGRWIIIAEIISALLYAFPRTAVLGAILLTGYLGGAIATHVRIDDPKGIMPAVIGVLVWLGLFLRDRRVRDLIPFRSK